MCYFTSDQQHQGVSEPGETECRYHFVSTHFMLAIYIFSWKTALYQSVSLTMHHCCQFFQDLLFSYNIAVDRSDEVKRTLGKSASSVGLQLPEVYQP